MTNRRILIVDDDSSRARELAEELRAQGHEGVEVVMPFAPFAPSATEGAVVPERGPAMDDRFFATALDLCCVLGFDGRFARVNPAWERALGFTPDELMSRPFIEFVHPDDRARTLVRNAIVRAGGQALAFENRYLCKDGSFRWLRWNATPDVGESFIYSVARDVTDNKRADFERETLVRELQEALAEVRSLRDILPICSYCRKIRDDDDYWHTVEAYIGQHTATQFSHSICPSCMSSIVEPQFEEHAGDSDRR